MNEISEGQMQDTLDIKDTLPGQPEQPDQDGLSRRELLSKIERFAYAAPALALLVEPTAAAGYGRGGKGGKGKGRGGKGGKGGKGGRGRADLGGTGSGSGASKAASDPNKTARGLG